MTTLAYKVMQPTPRQLLVVDDDMELCHLLSQYLTPEGYQVETVYCGADGV